MIGGILLTLALLCLGALIFKGIPAFDNAKDGASESARLKYFANWRRSAAWAFVWTAAAWAIACVAAMVLQEPGLPAAKYGAMIFGVFLFGNLIMIAVCYRSYRSLAMRHLNTAANEQMAVVLNVLSRK
jgi:uncharacterized membrane protein